MIVEDVFSKMSNILREYNRTHDFSGTNNHVFLVTPIVRQLIKEHYMCGPEGHIIKTLMYRGYTIWESANNGDDRLILFAEVHHAMNTGSMFDESPLWKYFKERKEVKKTMAIDYKKEWEKLRSNYGSYCVVVGPHTRVYLHKLMDEQTDATIHNREKLMEEYIKKQITTNIIGADGGYHTVKLEVFGESRGTVPVSKNAFHTWIKNRNKKGGK